MKPRARRRSRRNTQRKSAASAVPSASIAAASATVEPPLAWGYLLTAGVVLLLSFVAVIGGYADGTIMHVDMFQGDNWYLQELYRGIMDGYPVNGYRVGVAPMYFPETLTWLALAALLPADAVWFLCGLVVNLFGAAGWVMVCRRLGGGALSQSTALLAYAAQYLLLAYGGNEVFLLLVVHPIHNGAWQTVPWLLWACLNRRVSTMHAALLFALLAAVAAGDMVIVPWFVMPAALVIALQWRRGFIDKRTAVLLIAVITAAVAFGRLAHNLFGPFEESVNTGKFLTVRPDQWITGIENFFVYIARLAQQIPHLAFLWAIFAVFWSCVTWRVVRKSNNHAAVFVALFVPVSMLTACGVMFATGLGPNPNDQWLHTGDPRLSYLWTWTGGLRYIFPLALFPLLVGWSVLIALSWERRKPPVHRYLSAALAVCVFAAVPKAWGIDYQKNVSPFNTPFAVCMRDNAKRMGWIGGIGSWSTPRL